MKFVVSSTLLLSHLQTVGRVINSKNSMPILDNFLFSLNGNQLTITASDQETTMTTTIGLIEAEGSGLFAVSAKILLDPLRELPEQPLTFQVNDENLEIFLYYQNGKYNFVGVNGDEYPQRQPMNENATRFTMPASVLLNGVTRSLFAAANDELRPVMNGVCMDIHSEDIVFVASDGYILVRCRNTAVKSGVEATVILPKKPASLLKNILAKESGDITIEFDEKNICFHLSNFVLICRLIEGRYPNYMSVIPQNNSNRLIIDRTLFISVLRRISVFSDPANSLVRLDLSPNRLVVSAQYAGLSTAADESITCNYTGDTMCIGFSATQLVEILNNINSQEVMVDLADPGRAGILLPGENESDEDLLMLLMPMMLKD